MAYPRKSGDEDDIVQLYAGGLSAKKVAERLSTSVTRVLRVAGERGLPRHTSWDVRPLWEPPDLAAFLATFDGGASVKRMSVLYGISRSVIGRVLVSAGRCPRPRGDAERLKWSQMTKGVRKQQVAAAHAAVRGRKKSKDFLETQASARAFFLHTAAKNEFLLAEWLREEGLEARLQAPVGKYNVDLLLAPVAVEIHWSAYLRQSGAYGDRERIFSILDAGWHLLVIREHPKPLTRAAADHAIAWTQELRAHPSALRQYRVINGAGDLSATGSLHDDHVAVEWTARRGSNSLRIYPRPGQ